CAADRVRLPPGGGGTRLRHVLPVGAGGREHDADARLRPRARVAGLSGRERRPGLWAGWEGDAMTPLRVGFVGLGAMGLPMTRNLLEAGHTVTVSSRSRGPVDAALKLGAVDGGDPATVARASDVVILCVPSSPDVVAVADTLLAPPGP